jgi:hypothetical protein
MTTEKKSLLLCCLFSAMAGAAINDISNMRITQRVKVEIEQCERDLPRSQHCRIVALPVDKD